MSLLSISSCNRFLVYCLYLCVCVCLCFVYMLWMFRWGRWGLKQTRVYDVRLPTESNRRRRLIRSITLGYLSLTLNKNTTYITIQHIIIIIIKKYIYTQKTRLLGMIISFHKQEEEEEEAVHTMRNEDNKFNAELVATECGLVKLSNTIPSFLILSAFLKRKPCPPRIAVYHFVHYLVFLIPFDSLYVVVDLFKLWGLWEWRAPIAAPVLAFRGDDELLGLYSAALTDADGLTPSIFDF